MARFRKWAKPLLQLVDSSLPARPNQLPDYVPENTDIDHEAPVCKALAATVAGRPHACSFVEPVTGRMHDIAVMAESGGEAPVNMTQEQWQLVGGWVGGEGGVLASQVVLQLSAGW